MSLFKSFPKRHVDDEILELYFEIETLLSEISDKFEDYIRYVIETKYYEKNHKDKKYYSILKVYHFFHNIQNEFSHCFSLRSNLNNYDFYKSESRSAEKREIETELKILIKLLNKIKNEVLKLDKTDIKNNDFRELEKFIETFKKREEYLRIIKKEDTERVKHLLDKIIRDAFKNKKEGILLLDQKTRKNKLLVSYNFHINDLRILDLCEILPQQELGNIIVRLLHKDSTLPIYHYNIEVNGQDIHVVPKNFYNRLKGFLVA
ncbi:MAG: hypothetical protein PWP03_154 [Candidatus Woesearchaeota archaeon]|nr:hypothetical protein [Candidatus Woesearchaeota archaeon]MDN5327516.1 hypothetical protein [Candidatus Woesearchaeota archaeon]